MACPRGGAIHDALPVLAYAHTGADVGETWHYRTRVVESSGPAAALRACVTGE